MKTSKTLTMSSLSQPIIEHKTIRDAEQAMETLYHYYYRHNFVSQTAFDHFHTSFNAHLNESKKQKLITDFFNPK